MTCVQREIIEPHPVKPRMTAPSAA
jgi:hypothetical protein